MPAMRITLSAAMRARDVSRPGPQHEAGAAEADAAQGPARVPRPPDPARAPGVPQPLTPVPRRPAPVSRRPGTRSRRYWCPARTGSRFRRAWPRHRSDRARPWCAAGSRRTS